MPFTVSHASAIIPFNRKPFALSGLIAGSMSPDFLYYLPFIPNDEFTHSFSGLFQFCLPASLLILLIYHRLIKEPLIALFPEQLQGRLWSLTGGFTFLPLPRLGYISLSVLVGAVTHVVWDSFTHGGRASLYFPVLEKSLFMVADKDIQLYKLLQYLSTVLGLIIFCLWFARLTGKQEASGERKTKPRTKSLIIMLILAAGAGLAHGLTYLRCDTFRSFVVQTVIGSMGSFAVLLSLYSLIWQVQQRK